MSSPSLAVRIISREPVAQYQGDVYDQSVNVSLESDQQLSIEQLALFDDALRVSDSVVGDRVRATLSVLPSSNVKPLDESEFDIKEPESPVSEWSYDFVGEVVSVNRDSQSDPANRDFLLVLNVGIGDVIVEPNEVLLDLLNEGTLDVGDYVRITASRTNLAGLGE